MVIDNNRVNIFLVLRFIVNNHTIRFVGIVSYSKPIAILGSTIGEFSQPRNTRRKNTKMISIHHMVHYGACIKTTNLQFILHLSHPCTH